MHLRTDNRAFTAYCRAGTCGCGTGIVLGKDGCKRWSKGRQLAHLEQNLFRYPYRVGKDGEQAITITAYDTPAQELTGVAEQIRTLVMEQGYRYRDIAIVSGNLEETAEFAKRIFYALNSLFY